MVPCSLTPQLGQRALLRLRTSSSPSRYPLIVNPNAGRGEVMRCLPELMRVLKRCAPTYDVLASQPETLSQTLAHIQALPEDVAVVAVGGDGTVRSLLPALVASGRPLGIIPLGRGNDLVAALGWQLGRLEDAVTRLSLPSRALDVLEVRFAGEKTYSLNGLGMGFDAQVTHRAAQMPWFLGGFGQYALGALLSVAGLRACGLGVCVDGQLVFAGESFLAAVMNGRRYGGGFYISPRSQVADGLANVLIGHQVSRLGFLPLMVRVLRGQHLNHAKVTHVRGQHVTFHWAEPMHLHIDGDLYPPVGRLEVRLLPEAVELLGVPIREGL